MNPLRLARKEPNLCDVNALDMSGYRCFSGVHYWTRGHKEKVTSVTISFAGLDPDGCLVADQLKVHTKHLKNWLQVNKKGHFRAGWRPCKKNDTIFAMDRCFLLTRTF